MQFSNKTKNNSPHSDGLGYDEVQKYIEFLFESHGDHNSTTDELYRQEGLIPYPSHCLLAAQLLLADRQVKWSERKVGYLALLLHDVLEKTSAELPDWIDPEVKQLIDGLTLDRNNPEMSIEKQIFSKTPNIQFLILIDMYSSLYEEHVRPENQERWIKGMSKLVEILDPVYGHTNLFTVIKATLSRYL
jgi:(p)ppGpp synthase/HD superfamily hydrolase